MDQDAQRAAVSSAMEIVVIAIQTLEQAVSIPVGVALMTDETGAWRSYVARCRTIGQAVLDHAKPDEAMRARLQQALADTERLYHEALVGGAGS